MEKKRGKEEIASGKEIAREKISESAYLSADSEIFFSMAKKLGGGIGNSRRCFFSILPEKNMDWEGLSDALTAGRNASDNTLDISAGLNLAHPLKRSWPI